MRYFWLFIGIIFLVIDIFLALEAEDYGLLFVLFLCIVMSVYKFFQDIPSLDRQTETPEQSHEKKTYEQEVSIYDDVESGEINHLPTRKALEELAASDGEIPDY